MDIERLAEAMRSHAGVGRKHAIRGIVAAFDPAGTNPSFCEDAAILDYSGDECLLLAADGIWDRVMRADPEWAGYCAVLVNVHDIYAMGGRPIAMVDVFSSSSDAVTRAVLEGMKAGIDKFGVPIVGGHTHPDTPYAAMDVAILGHVKKENIIYSSRAEPGDDVVLAIDLDGRVHPSCGPHASCGLNWDSTFLKEAPVVRRQAESMAELGKRQLLTAGKDVSNPGILGTLGMILEASDVGAIVDVPSIPKPAGVEYMQWLRMYPGMGFIVTCNPEDTGDVLELYGRHGLTAAKIGGITEARRLAIADGHGTATVFDLAAGMITGPKPRGEKGHSRAIHQLLTECGTRMIASGYMPYKTLNIAKPLATYRSVASGHRGRKNAATEKLFFARGCRDASTDGIARETWPVNAVPHLYFVDMGLRRIAVLKSIHALRDADIDGKQGLIQPCYR